MTCPKCGMETVDSFESCKNCGYVFEENEAEEVKDLINEIIKEEDEEKKQQNEAVDQVEEEIEESHQFAIYMKRFLAGCIGVLVLMFLFPWFKLGGETILKGVSNIPSNMEVRAYKRASLEERKNYDGAYVEASPVDLIRYVMKNGEEYHMVIDEDGKEENSLFSRMQIGYIYGFLILVGLAAISIMILLLFKNCRGISIVFFSGVISFIIMLFNFLAMKIPFFNMFALNALSLLRKESIPYKVDMTQKGIAAGTNFYPYTLSLGTPFYIASLSIVIWIIVSFIMIKIGRKQKKIKTTA